MKRKLLKNTVASFSSHIVSIISGFILPRFILASYGSEVNGLINSIAQFLAIINFLEFGVGAVVQATLYRPLADKDNNEISRIVASAGKFFRNIAAVLLIYVIALMLVYPSVINKTFDYMYVVVLIFAMSINSFAQFYFGMVDGLFLQADQRGYVQSTTQMITLIVNTCISIVLIEWGASIQVVKLSTAIIYLFRPLVLRLYINKKYNINRRIKYDGEPIKQKWNGFAQHVASMVLDGTDSIVLTIFATLSEVSIYSVYHLVVYGVRTFFELIMVGVRSMFGELWAKGDEKKLGTSFEWLEWVINTGANIIWGAVFVLIVPFIRVYTAGVNDANYELPVFAFTITLAYYIYCLRFPYNTLILVAGHFKQTQNNYFIAAIMNIVTSIVMVNLWGIVGVAIGTVITMLYQTIWMAIYNAKELIHRSLRIVIKQCGVNVLSIVAIYLCTANIELGAINYLAWIIMAVKVVIISCIVTLVINIIFYQEKIMKIFPKMVKR